MKFNSTTISLAPLTAKINLPKLKSLLLAAILLAPSFAFADNNKDKVLATANEANRAEVKYKQKHSKLYADNSEGLFADGIKIKRDLKLLQEIQAERILSMDEIPAEELYGGSWNTKYVHVYSNLETKIDSFNVNLENFTMPIAIDSYVTSKFGPRGRRMHNGIDLKVQTGDTIYAAFEGRVRVNSFDKKGYGNYVAIRHPNGLETVYGHLSESLVTENDAVKSGDPIGLGGNTGRSTGSHLHLEFRFLGRAINPADIVDFTNYVCHKDEYIVSTKSLDYVRNNNKYTKGKLKFHRVRKGETLSAIARKYGTSITRLRKANNMKTNAILRVGTSLRI